MNDSLRDARHAARALARSPGFAATCIVTLALGMGATTAVFSVVNRVLIHPMPYAESDRLAVVRHPVPGYTAREWGLSSAGYFFLKEHARTLEDLGVFRGTAVTLTGSGDPEQLSAARITPSVLSTLRTAPVLGRPLSPTDAVRGAPPVVLLSHGLWTRRFGGDTGIVGRTIELDGRATEVVGVMPPGFAFPRPETAAWVPLALDPNAPAVNSHVYSAIARLAPGLEVTEAREDLRALVRRFPEEFPSAYSAGFMEESQFDVAVYTLLDDTVGSARRTLWIVLATVALVLVMACANVGNLVLVGAETRSREVAVRAALGASPGSLFRYALLEGGLLATLGGAASVFVAWAGVRLLVAFAPQGLPRLANIRLDLAALGLTAGLVAVVGLAFAALPVARRDLANISRTLRAAGRMNTSGRAQHRLRAGLAVSQVAMALVLMAGAGLLLRSYMTLRAVELGFDPTNVLTFRIGMTGDRYDGQTSLAFVETLKRRLEGLPNVEAVGTTFSLPIITGPSDNANELGNLPDGAPDRNALVDTKFVGSGYFEALGMRLLEGRTMERADHDMAAPGAVITRSMAETYWPGQPVLGRRLRPLMMGNDPWHRIVGVIDEVHTQGIDVETEPTVYFPYTYLRGAQSMVYAVRTTSNPLDLVPLVRAELRALDPNLPVAEVATMNEVVADDMAQTTFTFGMLAVSALVALTLGAVGLYGVVSYVVNQRTSEIGLRLALGAPTERVLGMVLRQTLTLAGVGIGIGLVAAMAVNRLMESLLTGVRPSDGATLVVVSALLAGVAVVAGYVPARRASRVDPLAALRAE